MMSLPSLLALLALIIVLPALSQRKWPQALQAPFLAAALGYLAVILATYILLTTKIKLSQTTTSGQYHDTYYVVVHFHQFLGMGLFLAAIGAVIGAQGRWLSHPLPRLVPWLFWALHLGYAVSVLPAMAISQFVHPRRYVDFEASFGIVSHLTIWGSFTSFSALILLCALLLWAIIRKIRGR